MTLDDCFVFGWITRLHGYKGEFLIKADVDSPMQYRKMESVLALINGELVPFFFKTLAVQPNGLIRGSFEGYEQVDRTKELIGFELYLPLSVLPKLKGKKFYYHEIIGFTALDKAGAEIGTIQNIFDNSTQPIFQIMAENNVEILIPVIDDFIGNLDRAKQTITLTPPDGLIDLYRSHTPDSEEDKDL